jgi:hypothetical protein
LHPILVLGVGLRELELGGDGVFAEDLLDDGGDRGLVEDAVVPALAEEPHHGDDADEVGREADARAGGGLDADLLHLGDDACPRARGERLVDEEEAGCLADDRLEIDVLVGGARDDGDVELGRHCLVHGEPAHAEGVFAGLEGQLEDGHESGWYSSARSIRKERPGKMR